MTYQELIASKLHYGSSGGFEPIWMPKNLFPVQEHLVNWACRNGRSAIFADCGLGKTAMQLTWAANVKAKTGKPVLIFTPLAVGRQTVSEGVKFGIECAQSRDGSIPAEITVTNYQQIHKFDSSKFGGVVCDESSCIKDFDGKTKAAVTEFMRLTPYRLLCTATAAPNDYIELGTSSEALGHLGFMDMLGRFFKKSEQTTSRSDEFRSGLYRFRGHAKDHFWRWVCSWARALRMPSDLGFDNAGFVLPPLITNEHVVSSRTKNEEFLFDMPAVSLAEQRDERRRTMTERCELAASIINATGNPAVAWCHLNPEGKLLEKLIPGSVEVSGDDHEDFKEETFESFSSGQLRVIISKSSIAGLGFNWQHCAHQTHFPSHSFEAWYQSIRRCWRYGQKNPVRIDMITSEGEARVMSNLRRKAAQSDEMFRQLIGFMNDELKIEKREVNATKIQTPAWI